MSARSRTRWTTTGTASAVVLRPLAAFARQRGLPTAPMLDAAGLTAADLDEFDLRIPEAVRSRAWAAVAEQIGERTFGLQFARESLLGAFDVLDYALMSSATVSDGLERVSRFHRILCDSWAVDFTRLGNGDGCLRRRARTQPTETEALFAVLVLRAQELTGLPLSPRLVRFSHAADGPVAPFVELFGCPVEFGCAETALIIAAAHLAVPAKTPDPGLRRVLDRYLKELVARQPPTNSFPDTVRALLAERIRAGAKVSLPSVAASLHCSARTLQRRLAEHALGFQEVLDSVRREIAVHLITERHLTVTEATFLSGFSEVSAFRRHFKRWTGTPPSRAPRRWVHHASSGK